FLAISSMHILSLCFFSSRRRHTRSVSAFLLNRSSDLKQPDSLTVNAGNGGFLHCIQMDTSVNAANQVVSVGADIAFDADPKFFRSEERRVGKECRSRWSPYD